MRACLCVCVCYTRTNIYIYIHIYIFQIDVFFDIVIKASCNACTVLNYVVVDSERYSRYSFVNRILGIALSARIVEIAQLEPKCDFSQKRQSVTNKSIDSTTIKRVIGRQVGDAIVEKELANYYNISARSTVYFLPHVIKYV